MLAWYCWYKVAIAYLKKKILCNIFLTLNCQNSSIETYPNCLVKSFNWLSLIFLCKINTVTALALLWASLVTESNLRWYGIKEFQVYYFTFVVIYCCILKKSTKKDHVKFKCSSSQKPVHDRLEQCTVWRSAYITKWDLRGSKSLSDETE